MLYRLTLIFYLSIMFIVGDNMKLHINYDFFEAVRDVREVFGPITIVRNNKYTFFFTIPSFAILFTALGFDASSVFFTTAAHSSLFLLYDYIDNYQFKKEKHIDFDEYTYYSAIKLVELAHQLEEINVMTKPENLLDAELYAEKHQLIFNEHKIPMLEHDKYILIPAYNRFNGEEMDISLLQEHIVGTKDYELSIGEPEKKYRRVLVKNNG